MCRKASPKRPHVHIHTVQQLNFHFTLRIYYKGLHIVLTQWRQWLKTVDTNSLNSRDSDLHGWWWHGNQRDHDNVGWEGTTFSLDWVSTAGQPTCKLELLTVWEWSYLQYFFFIICNSLCVFWPVSILCYTTVTAYYQHELLHCRSDERKWCNSNWVRTCQMSNMCSEHPGL